MSTKLFPMWSVAGLCVGAVLGIFIFVFYYFVPLTPSAVSAFGQLFTLLMIPIFMIEFILAPFKISFDFVPWGMILIWFLIPLVISWVIYVIVRKSPDSTLSEGGNAR